MKRFPASVISGTAVVPSLGSAPGVWSREQQIQAQTQGSWPINPALADPYFPYVSLLLHGDGTNAAQNNTFIDSSVNNLTITRGGNTTQGSYSPYGTLWSNYFDGTGDYLSFADTSVLAFGVNPYTVEFWINPSATPSDYKTILYSSGNLRIFQNLTSNFISIWNSGTSVLTTSTALQNGAWTHVAIVRTSTASNGLKIYLNGVANATGTDATTWTAGTGIIGYDSATATRYYRGNLSNIRVVKGTAVYTTDFTPPSSPLTAVTNTVLLTCQSNRFVDNSSTGAAITRNGDVIVSRFSPFSPSTPYATSTIGGSGYFDGNLDYVLTPTSSVLGFGTGDFTIECWAYLAASGATNGYILFDMRSAGGSEVRPSIQLTSAATILYWTQPTAKITGGTLVVGMWNHIAVARASGNTRMFVNGLQAGSTYVDSTDYGASNRVTVGNTSDFPSSYNASWNGYVSNFRILKGTALYTTGFTPPAAPLTAITNTSLLLSTINGAIFDNAMQSNLETVGTAQISTGIVKYGTGSILFQGAGNRLSMPTNQSQLALGAGDFTVEAWVYRTVSGSGTILYGQSDNSTIAGSSYAFFVSGSATSDLYVGSTTYAATSPNPALNQWAHVAYVRNGTSYKTYLNGTQVGSATLLAGATVNVGATTTGPTIGTTGGNMNTLVGYIDDLRVTKGIARYTANFTPPTAAFPNQ